MESGVVPAHLAWDVGLNINYADDPLVLFQRDSVDDLTRVVRLLERRADAHFHGAIGLFGFMQLGVDLPLTFHQSRDEIATGTLGLSDVNNTGVGDLGISAKFRILSEEYAGVALAVMPKVSITTANPTGEYLGERTTSGQLQIALSKNVDAWRIAANVGALFRQNLPSRSIGLNIDHELIGRLGVGYDLKPDTGVPITVDIASELFTQLKRPFKQSNTTGLEALAGASVAITDLVSVYAGGGFGILNAYSIPDYRAFAGVRLSSRDHDRDDDGIVDRSDACPEEPEDEDGHEDSDGCPDPDNDSDGVLDTDDLAPNLPEDKDGFQDDDGKPDPDNDADGVRDTDDSCPNEAGPVDNDGCPYKDDDADGVVGASELCPQEPEDIDGFQDDDGCPDLDNDNDGVLDTVDNCPNEPGSVRHSGCKKKQLVKITAEKIELLQRVYFDTGKSTIRKRSHALLDNVVRVLKAHSKVKRVRVEGHTDSRGSAASNQRLSQARAESVMTYLTTAGLAPERLEATGYGESRPIDTNKTRSGRANNRRVEFVIVDDQTSVETE